MLLEHDCPKMGPQLSHVYEAVRKNGEYKGVKFPASPSAMKEERAKVIGKKWSIMQINYAHWPPLCIKRAVSDFVMVQIDAIILHLEERMKDLERDSPISRFRAFVPSG